MPQQTLPDRELILRNGQTHFVGDEILGEAAKFDDAFFQSVREGNYTAIWIRGQLRQLVHFAQAPHWANRVDERMDALRTIVERGQTHGIGVYLYFNEPTGFEADDPIFEQYPDLRGPLNPLRQKRPNCKDPMHAFCTQSAFTETYLVGGFQQLFSDCPNLKGVILITASEILSHCYANVDLMNALGEDFKFRKIACPRCEAFSAAQVVGDVIEKIQRGIRAANSTAKVVAWNWSWNMYEPSPQAAMIEALPPDVAVMCDMQRGGEKQIDDQRIIVDEYSFSYLGPSPLFHGVANAAHAQGRPLWAKIMVNATHEFLATPYLPLPWRLAKKMIAIRDLGTTGAMCCWNYGCERTWMSKLAARAFTDPTLTCETLDDTVAQIAADVYGPDHAAEAVAAWQHFDAAFEWFPFDLNLVYYGPHQYGPGFEWIFTPDEIPMPWYWVRGESRGGTRLADWCVQFTPQRIIELFERLTREWVHGVDRLAQRFDITDPLDAIEGFEKRVGTEGFEDFNYARTIYLHYLSTIAFVRFRLATLDFFAGREGEARKVISQLLIEEKPRIRAMRQILEHYPQVAFNQEPQQRMYTEADLDGRMANMQTFAFTHGQRI